MVNWNPNFPEVLGLEWLMTRGLPSRVWAGAPSRGQRIVSTVTEPITDLKLSGWVNPLLSASVPTVIDVVEEGNEYVALPKLKRMTPSVDRANGGWTKGTGVTTSLFNHIDDPTTKWPSPNTTTETQWIQTVTPGVEYTCAVNTSIFQAGGAAENGRIFWLAANAIMGANTGFRKLSVKLVINGQLYDPAGGATRDVHGYGAIYTFWWGELNPATKKPWTPAEIAKFGTDATWGLRVRSSPQATSSHYPKVFALSLDAYYSETENREAVGVWIRPEDMTDRLVNITTDSLTTVPSGTAGWAKETGKNYLCYWRQSVTPCMYGPIVADDIRWNGQYQALSRKAQPPWIVRPLYNPNADESTHLAGDETAFDHFGRPSAAFDPDRVPISQSSAGLVLTATPVSGTPAPSVDSQPYRLDLADLAFLHSSQTLGQQVTPASTQSYVGVRVPLIPPQAGPAGSTLTIGVYAVSGGAQVGGSLTLTEDEVRKLPSTQEGIRMVAGVFSAAASLSSGTAYEVRVSTTAPSTKPWILFMPDSSLGPEVSFGGTTDGAYIGAAHQTSRDLVINLVRQPDAPVSVTAVATNVPVTMPDGTTRDVDHALVSWEMPPVSPLGSSFARYEVERQMAGETTWTRVIDIPNDGLTSHVDHLAKRSVPTTYRVRQIATDGRFSAWTTASPLTIEPGDYSVILTSNHRPDLEVLLDVDLETTYEFLSTANDEIVPIHGSDHQVVFMSTEDRGMRWQFNAEVNFDNDPEVGKTGDRVFDRLNALVRAEDVPYVAMLDYQGTRVLGHVTPSAGKQKHPGNVYATTLDLIPTHSVEETLDGPMIAFINKSISDRSISTLTDGYVSTPNDPSYATTGVLDLRWEITLPSATFGSDQGIGSIWRVTGADRRWAPRFLAGGQIRLFHSPDGIATESTTSGVAIAQAGRVAYRVVWNPNNGSNREMRCYRASSIDSKSWTLVNTATDVPTTLYAGGTSAPLTVASQDTAIPLQNALLHAFEMRKGENGPVAARWDADNLNNSTTTFTGDNGKVWTLAGTTASIQTTDDTAPIPGGAKAGDLLVAFAYRELDAPPSLAAGWTKLADVGGATNSFVAAYRFWDGTFVGPAWTNATSVIILAYRGVDPVRPVGAQATFVGSSANIPSLSAGGFQAVDRTSWGLSMYGRRGNTNYAPTIGAERADFYNAGPSGGQAIGACDSNGGVVEWDAGQIEGGGVGTYGSAVIALELRAKQ